MDESNTRPTEYPKPIEYRIIRELHEGEKNAAELSDILAQKTKDEIFKELHQGNRDLRDLSSILFNSRGLISIGLNGLINKGYVNKKDVIFKKPEDNKPGRKGQIYFLTETGQKAYQSVYL